MSKKWQLKANDSNLVSTCTGLIKELLAIKRGEKVFHDFDDTFGWFDERVSIPMELRQRNSDGEVKWKQAIRNAAKVHRTKKTPDALTQGELMALVHGGFALPDHVPPDRKVVKFPDIGGFKLKPKPKPKKLDPLKDPTFWADACMGVMKDLDDGLQSSVIIELAHRFNMDIV